MIHFAELLKIKWNSTVLQWRYLSSLRKRASPGSTRLFVSIVPSYGKPRFIRPPLGSNIHRNCPHKSIGKKKWSYIVVTHIDSTSFCTCSYSKLKYLTLIFEQRQDTLFQCLDDAFKSTGGVPQEIWFDNMKQVVDHSKSAFGKASLNGFASLARTLNIIRLCVVHFDHKLKVSLNHLDEQLNDCDHITMNSTVVLS